MILLWILGGIIALVVCVHIGIQLLIPKHHQALNFLVEQLKRNNVNAYDLTFPCLREIIDDTMKYVETLKTIDDMRSQKTHINIVITDDLMLKAYLTRVFMHEKHNRDYERLKQSYNELYATLAKYGHV